MKARKLVAIVGTRPEAIKMAPVILALRAQPWADVTVVATAQHREMLDDVLSFFDIEPDIDLNAMRPNQPLADLTARLLSSLDRIFERDCPSAVLAQGDTTTVLTSALASFYRRIPFGHVEAGLRTHDLDSPFPEEANRVIAGVFAKWHFAPTESARDNLRRAKIDEETIFVTGNTVIDALISTAATKPALGLKLPDEKRLILITAHRRENFGEPFANICSALRELAQRNRHTHFLYPVHPNPNIREPAYSTLCDIENMTLCDPLGYQQFVAAMSRAYFVISDSGGVQEEAPALGKPVLVLRNETERPEAVEAGVVKLVGTDHFHIVQEAQKLLDDRNAWTAMARGVSPYGDGKAAGRIVNHLECYFKKH